MNCIVEDPRQSHIECKHSPGPAGLLSPNMNIHWVILCRMKKAKVRMCIPSSLPTYAISSAQEIGRNYHTDLLRSCLSVPPVCLCQCLSFPGKVWQWALQAHSLGSQAAHWSKTKLGWGLGTHDVERFQPVCAQPHKQALSDQRALVKSAQ